MATWLPVLQELGVEVVFLVGMGDSLREARLAGTEEHGRVGIELQLPCPDDYASLPQKTRLFCQWALANREFEYLFKCDEDTYLVPERLLSIDTWNADYLGGEWAKGVGYGSGGAGYLMSRKAATLVADALTEAQGSENLLVGKHLETAGFEFRIDQRFVAHGNDENRPKPGNDIITTHACGDPWDRHEETWQGGGFKPTVCSPALIVMATKAYRQFLEPLLKSCERFFFSGREYTVYVFSDEPYEAERVVHIECEHAPWPSVTLNRAGNVLAHREQLDRHDFLLLTDVDLLLVGSVGDEIVGDLVAVEHPGFSEAPRSAFTYETRPESAARVGGHEGERYYAGGVIAGRREAFFRALQAMAERIATDAAKGITAIWHDESHWNRYLIDRPPNLSLDRRYCCPESWQIPDRRILALDKNHAAMRSS